MSVIRLQHITKRYDERQVLRDINFRLSDGDRVGLIGRNGSGKSTVLRLILGLEKPTEGDVDIEPGVRISYFSQFSELSGHQSAQEVLEDVLADIRAIEDEMRDVEDRMAAGVGDDELDAALHRQSELIEAMTACDGWDYRVRINTVLSKLGFDDALRHRPIEQLSGGWRNRACLAKILLEDPDVLLLDEPTNYLDVEGLAWLEGWFRRFRGGVIIVSHDRHFLDQVVTRIVEVENYHFHEYEGSFADYVRDKSRRFRTLQREFQHEEELLTFEAEAIADRREAAKDPSGALKRKLATIKKQETPRPVDEIITGIYERLHVGTKQLRVEGLGKAYGEQLLFCDLEFELQKGERLVIVGPNGCGKTSLLKALTGQVEPDDGRVVWAPGNAYVYFNQWLDDLDLTDTVSHAVNTIGMAYKAPRKQVHRFLGLMQFSEQDLQQRIGVLSGGQKARVALAQCLLSGAGTLVLDEPTNHLDLQSTQVMERALAHFPGAIIAVSHDRFFIDKIATRLLVFDGQGGVEQVAGNWTIWRASRAVW